MKKYLIYIMIIIILSDITFFYTSISPFVMIIAGLFQFILIKYDKPSKEYPKTSGSKINDIFTIIEGIFLIIVGLLWYLV